MHKQDISFLIRIYFSVWKWHRWTVKAAAWARGCFVGLWLGVFSREQLHAIDEEFYTRSKKRFAGQWNYHSQEYNRSGLFDYEKKVLPNYFGDCRRLLLYGAGGGRDTLALLRMGYRVDAFESHPDLAVAANELLRQEGYDPVVQLVPRDQGPTTDAIYDGIIVSYGTYMLIQGRKHRIRLLRQLRAQTQVRCPIFISFFHRNGTPRRYKASVLVANIIRRTLRREFTELGDWLDPYYRHHFTEEEIVSELFEGGFDIIHYDTTGYGHAIGTAI